MTDTYERPVDINKVIERLCPNPSLLTKGGGAPLESGSTNLYNEGDEDYDTKAKSAQGLNRFEKPRAHSRMEHDVQSEIDEICYFQVLRFVPQQWSEWIDLDIEEDKSDAASALTARQLVNQLKHASGSERSRLIIEAEALQFEGDDRALIVAILKEYVEQYRDITDREELIAVSAAIRKCVALIDYADMGWLAALLESGHRVQPSLDAELEIAKMVFRRYSALPAETPDPHPELSARLAELVVDYLRPRVFERPRFSTIAMLAIQALLVMRSEHVPTIVGQVNALRFAWFRQQLRRRMERTIESIGPASPVGQHIREFNAMIRSD